MILAVDGNNILMRAVKAAEGGHLALSNEAGTPTAALLIFINSMSKYVKQIQPDSILVCWDSGRSTARTLIFPEYKGARSTPDAEAQELKESAFELARQFLALANIHHIAWPGFEADDLIAAVWSHRLDEMTILSGDKDLLQLVRPGDRAVVQVRPGQADERWDAERVEAELGCNPRHWGLVLAMAGDPGDGVPGIKRVGVKTACKDLTAAGWDLDELLRSGHERYRSPEAVEIIRRNIKLVCLPMPESHDALYIPSPHPFRPTTPDDIAWADLLSFLDRYDMASVRARLLAGELWN